jgi:predicted transcriptional regulator
MDSLEQVSGLYFELSNPDRLKILRSLKETPRRLTELAEDIGITHQQCVRHLKRLSDIHLVERNGDGLYSLTSFGVLVHKLTPGLVFVSNHSEYFTQHSLSHIPSEFISRIGELSQSTLFSNVMEAISEIESIIKHSEEILYVFINKRTHSIRPSVADAVRRGVQIKSISITSYTPNFDVRREVNRKDEEDIIEAERKKTVMVADQTDFPVYIYLSEKAAFLAFPLHDESFDYTGFHSTDPVAVKYCRDLFDYYWSRTKIIPAPELVDRHTKYVNLLDKKGN